MITSTAVSFWDDLVDPLKVIFDGDNKLIYIAPQYNTINVKIDLYSAAKRWLQRRQNMSYLPPLRSIGGDSVGSGLYAGDIYFLTNNWRVDVTNTVSITGILYQDNLSLDTYIVEAGGGVISTVANLAYAYNTTGVTVPSAAEIRDEILGANPSTYANTETVGGKIYDTKEDTSEIKTNTDNIIALTV